MSNPAENWKCKCGRPPSLEHGIGEYCQARISIEKLESERDALAKEVERLSGKTQFCPQCEVYAKEIEGLKEKLQK